VRRSTPTLLLSGVVAVGLVLYAVAPSVQKIRDDSGVRAYVRLVSTTPVRAAGVQAVGRPDHFDGPLEAVSPNSLRYWVPDEGLRGERFEILVPGGN
jgi:hypothetical protein